MEFNTISDALIISEKRPRRYLFSRLSRHYSIIVGVIISLITVTASCFIDIRWCAAFLLAYWMYLLVKLGIRKKSNLRESYRSQKAQFGRSVFLLLGTTLMLGILYHGTDYWSITRGQDSLWLLFLMAILITSQRGSTMWMIWSASVASVCLVIVLAPTSLLAGDFVSIGAIGSKLGWLWLLAFVVHVLVRHTGDSYANLNLLHEVQSTIRLFEEQVIEDPSDFEFEALLGLAVSRLAQDLEYPHVTAFLLNQQGDLECVAAACDMGSKLVSEGFVIEASQRSIATHVLQTEESYGTNNVKADPFFLDHPMFPDTKSELAIPLKVADEIIGVLDVQVHHKNFFYPEDQRALEIMADYLGRVIGHSRMHAWRENVSAIIESISTSFLSHHELIGTLNAIAEAAHDELDADVVILYGHNPVTKELTGPIHAGHLIHQQAFNRAIIEPDNLVYRLLVAKEDCFLHEDLDQIPERHRDLFAPAEFHNRTGNLAFAEREGIRSRAVFRLLSSEDCVGLLFLNYRSPQALFRQDEKMFGAFANLASLAIQKALYHQQQIQVERRMLASNLHDRVLSQAFGLSQILNSITDDGKPDRRETKLGCAKDCVRAMQENLRHLIGLLDDNCLDSFSKEIEKVILRNESLYRIKYHVHFSGDDSSLAPPVIIQLLSILEEASANSVRHGKATEISLATNISQQEIQMTVEDNGLGFEPDDMMRRGTGGLFNMRERVEKLRGNVNIRTAVNCGTKIEVTIPR